MRMTSILVEARKDPLPRRILDALANECARQGYEVTRWRGPLSGRVPHSRWLPECDLAILFNGAHERYDYAISRLRQVGAKLLFAELGWLPQSKTFQLDPQGVNANASWVSQTLEPPGKTPLPCRTTGDLLVPLQLDEDTQITRLSPWFQDMAAFVEHLAKNSVLPIRLRAHPQGSPSRRVREIARDFRLTWDNAPTFAKAMETCRAVATINSTCGAEALHAGLPVLCHGRAIYRRPGAVHCLSNDHRATAEVTTHLSRGSTRLSRESIFEAVLAMEAAQWTMDQIPTRFPKLLRDVLTVRAERGYPLTRWVRTARNWSLDLVGYLGERLKRKPSRKAA